jgi:hypothetical protein
MIQYIRNIDPVLKRNILELSFILGVHVVLAAIFILVRSI